MSEPGVTELLAEWDSGQRPQLRPDRRPLRAVVEQHRLSNADLSSRLGGDPPAGSDTEPDVDDNDRPDVDDSTAGDQFDERDERIEELESENARLTAADVERADRAEWDRSARYIKDQGAGVPLETIKSVILGEFVGNEEFRDAFAGRGQDPVSWQFALEELVDRFPSSDHGMSAAVLSARDAVPSGRGGDHPYGDMARMGPHEFDRARREVFADMKAGNLRATGGTGHAIFTTRPR